jgi:Holliday junction resolvase RusA-like endonuclease
MIYRFTIPGRLPSLNQVIAACRWHPLAGHSQKKKWTRYCGMSAIHEKVPKFVGPVRLHIRWIEKDRRRDRDNIQSAAKFVLDGLVLAGVIRGDSQRWVTDLTHEIAEPDPKNPRIEVTIEQEESHDKRSDIDETSRETAGCTGPA